MTFDVIHPDPSGHFLVTDSGQPFFLAGRYSLGIVSSSEVS